MAEIRLSADVRHNLPGGERPRAAGDHEPLVRTWQTAGAFTQDWMRTRLQEGGFDLAFLEQAPSRAGGFCVSGTACQFPGPARPFEWGAVSH
ncbi:hypothetical protein AB0C31_39685, partial [Actinoplanes philippinensis]